jgi:hypothetical protein
VPVDPLSLSAEIATILQLGTTALPSGTSRRAVSRNRQEEAYLAFHRASQDLALWSVHLQALATAQAPTPQRLAVVPGLLARALPRDWTGGTLARLFEAASEAAQIPLATDQLGDLMREWVAYREVGAAREAVTAFIGALAQLRLLGRPEPLVEAEKISVLLLELYVGIQVPHFMWRTSGGALIIFGRWATPNSGCSSRRAMNWRIDGGTFADASGASPGSCGDNLHRLGTATGRSRMRNN